MLLSLTLLLASTPVDVRFVMEVAGVPVAELRVKARGQRYIYEATHFLEEGPLLRRLERNLRDGKPEVLALLTPPPLGCQSVVEERTGEVERLCVTFSGETSVVGTVEELPFVARYRAGQLIEIDVGPTLWRRVPNPVKPPAESPFSRGVAVRPDATHLVPAVAGARWLGAPPRGVGTVDAVGRVRCLKLARHLAAQRPGAQVVVGLLLEGDRAWPHAWVMTTSEGALDPSVLPDDEVLQRRRYLEVPRAEAGRFFLSFFEGATVLR